MTDLKTIRLWVSSDSNALSRPPRRRLEKILIKILQTLPKHLKNHHPSVELHFVRSSVMKKLNFKYRGRNRPTDVLSFNSVTPGLLGSLVIDIDIAREQAKDYGHAFEQEIVELFIHGVLHLLGFDHENAKDAKMMAKYERLFIGSSSRSSVRSKKH